MNDIKDFHIGTAFYILENNKGSSLKLVLNYSDNTFTMRVLKDKGALTRLKAQAGIIARDMLSRKAQKNLAYKLLQLNTKV